MIIEYTQCIKETFGLLYSHIQQLHIEKLRKSVKN